MNETERKAAITALREKVAQLRDNTLTVWIYAVEADETGRNHMGYSKGAEAMCQQLLKIYNADMAKLMRPFDRGDYDIDMPGEMPGDE